MAPPNISPEETIGLLNARAKEGVDSFMVKVMRRRGITGMLEHIATLSGAQVVHIANPEQWLPKLCGGGSFGLAAYPHDNPTLMIGGYINYTYRSPEKDVDPWVVNTPVWNGPAQVIFPPIEDRGTQSLIPGAPGAGNPAFAATTVGSGPGMSPFSQQQQLPASPTSQGSAEAGWVKSLEERVRLAEQDVARRERDLARQEVELKEKLAQERAAIRESQLRAEFEAKNQAMLAEIRALTSKKDDSGGIDKLIAAVTPIATALIQANNSTRELMAKQQADSAAANQAFLATLVNRPGISPEMQIILDIVKSKGSESKDQIEAMGMVNKTALSMLNTVADMNFGGQQEHPVMAAIKEVTKAVSVMSRAQSRPQPQPQPQQYPQNGNGNRQPQQYSFQQQAQFPAIASRPMPVQPSQENSQVPMHLPVTDPVAAGSGFAEMALAQPQPQPNVPPATEHRLTVVDEIEVMIKNFEDPTEVATKFLRSLGDPDMIAAIAQAEGSPEQLVEMRLGEWAQADERNGEYLAEVMDEVQRLGVEAGLISTEDEGEPEEDNASA